jgi:hypothetical protein
MQRPAKPSMPVRFRPTPFPQIVTVCVARDRARYMEQSHAAKRRRPTYAYSSLTVVPADLRPHIHRREIVRTLETSNLRDAQLRAAQLGRHVASLFSRLRREAALMAREQRLVVTISDSLPGRLQQRSGESLQMASPEIAPRSAESLPVTATDAATLSVPEIPSTVHDIHAPQEGIHSWLSSSTSQQLLSGC